MKPSEVIYQLREFNDTWRRQSFYLNDSQQQQYDFLISLRRERVRELYKEGRVSKGGLRQKEKDI